MTIKSALAAVLLASGLLLAGGCGCGNSTGGGLVLSIGVPEKSGRVGEVLPLKIELTNHSGAAAKTKRLVLDERSVLLGFEFESVRSLYTRKDASSYGDEVELASGESLELIVDFTPARAGEYLVGAKFGGPAGEIVCDPVPFSVKDAAGSELTARIKTEAGDIVLEFYWRESLATAEHFIRLVLSGHYDGMYFGDMRVRGRFDTDKPYLATVLGRGKHDAGLGTPNGPADAIPVRKRAGYSFARGNTDVPHERGAVGMWLNPFTNYSDGNFYFATGPLPGHDGLFTVFARVVEGMEVVDAISSGPCLRSDIGSEDTTRLAEPVIIEKVALELR